MDRDGQIMSQGDSQHACVTKDEFAQLMIDTIRKGGVQEPIKYDKACFRLLVGPPSASIGLGLNGAYYEYCEALKEDREGVLVKHAYVASASPDIPESWADAKPQLMPLIFARSWLSRAQLDVQVKGDWAVPYVWNEFAQHFVAAVLYAKPEVLLGVPPRILETWKVSVDDALAVAVENLRRRTQPAFTQVMPGLYVSEWQDGYAASRVLLPELIQNLKVKGDPVAMLPIRDMLIIGGSDDDDGLEHMACLARAESRDPNFMGAIPIRWDGQTWHTFEPDIQRSIYGIFREQYLETAAMEANRQVMLLQKLYKGTYASEFMTSRSPSSAELRSASLWVNGIPSLLLRTDDILFANVKSGATVEVFGQARWEDVKAVVGHLMKPIGTYPERYRVDQFPNARQLQEVHFMPL